MVAGSLRDKLATIKILFRAPDTLGLYGVPYEMRPGQQPGDLWKSRDGRVAVHDPGPRSDWVFLGYPGWWGHVSRDDQTAIEQFLTPLAQADLVPGGPYEWNYIDRPLPVVEPLEENVKRELDSGRYAPELDRLCVCGHKLGHHVAERTRDSQPCLAGELLGEDCDCELFKAAKTTPNPRRRSPDPELGNPCVTPNRASTLGGRAAMKTTFGRDIDPDDRAIADLDKAMDRYETFHAKRPLRTVELAHELPSSLVPVGEAQSTMYRTDKWHKDGNDEDYKHVHDKGEKSRYEFGEGVVVYEPAREASKSTLNGKRVGKSRKAVKLPVSRPKALSLLGYCLGFFVRRYDDGEIYEVNPRGCYLFCSPTGNMLAVYSPEEQPDGSRGFLAVMAGGNLRVLKDGIDG